MDLTKILAWWGAIVATFVAGWNFYRDRLDRPKLKVDMMFGSAHFITPGQALFVSQAIRESTPINKGCIFIFVHNCGHRPIFVKNVIYRLKKAKDGKKWAFVVPNVGDSLPRLLKEAESLVTWIEDESKITPNVKFLGVKDANGKIWKVPKKQFHRVIKELQEKNKENKT